MTDFTFIVTQAFINIGALNVQTVEDSLKSGSILKQRHIGRAKYLRLCEFFGVEPTFYTDRSHDLEVLIRKRGGLRSRLTTLDREIQQLKALADKEK